MQQTPTAHHAYPSPVRSWSSVLILGVVVLLAFTDRLVITLVLDDVRRDLALGEVAISVAIGTGFALMYAVVGFPLGRLADRVNRRNLIVLAILVWTVSTAACGLAGSFSQLLLARIGVGLGEAALIPAANSMISDTFPEERRGRALGLFAMGALLGSGIALTIGGSLLGLAVSGTFATVPGLAALAPWRVLLVLAGLPGIPLVLLVLLFVREPSRKGGIGRVQPLRTVLGALVADRARVGRLCFSFGIVAAGDYGLLTWLPSTLIQSGLTAAYVGTVVGVLVSATGLAGALLAGYVSDRLAARNGSPARLAVTTASFALCLASGLLFFVPDPTLRLVAAGGWIVGSVAGSVSGQVRLQEAVPNEMRGTLIGLSNMTSAIVGGALGPTLVAVIATAGGSSTGSGAGLGVGIAVVCAAAAAFGTVMVAPRLVPAALRRREVALPEPERA